VNRVSTDSTARPKNCGLIERERCSVLFTHTGWQEIGRTPRWPEKFLPVFRLLPHGRPFQVANRESCYAICRRQFDLNLIIAKITDRLSSANVHEPYARFNLKHQVNNVSCIVPGKHFPISYVLLSQEFRYFREFLPAN
jgi:hypothetical protein